MTKNKTGNAKPMPSQARLKFLFNYCDDGNLIWKNPQANSCKVGDVAGTLNKKTGYINVRVDGDRYYLHRLIFHWHTGKLTQYTQIDHENRNQLDNRIENLREATPKDNGTNRGCRSDSELKIKGVSPVRCKGVFTGKYQAHIQIMGKQKSLGLYTNIFEAREAFRKKEKEIRNKEFISDEVIPLDQLKFDHLIEFMAKRKFTRHQIVIE